MPNIDDIFGSKYLTAADLGGQERLVVIKFAVPAILGQGEKAAQKIIITITNPQGAPMKKQFVCNRTNGRRIASAFGKAIEGWAGKSILLRPEMTEMGRELVPCIRVQPVTPDAETVPPTEIPSKAPAGDQGVAVAGAEW